jgi:hypothetical protein
MAEAEWGMLTMQASFPRVKDRFVYEERGEQRIVLKMFVILYNIRLEWWIIIKYKIHTCGISNAMQMKMFGFN